MYAVNSLLIFLLLLLFENVSSKSSQHLLCFDVIVNHKIDIDNHTFLLY